MSQATTKLLIDTHVHLYARYDLVRLFNAAIDSMRPDAVAELHERCLMLTETSRDDRYAALRDGEKVAGWTIDQADECSLTMVRDDGVLLRLFAGGQTNTAERIEVLTLGTTQRIDDGLPLDKTMELAIDTGGVVVLPFGLGKWVGKRGGMVAAAFENYHERGVRLGDNAGRPRSTGTPALFKRSQHFGHAVLPGSDPLNTALGETAAGRYGLVCKAPFDPQAPTASICQLLRTATLPVKVFGNRVSLVRCMREQFLLRVEKAKAK